MVDILIRFALHKSKIAHAQVLYLNLNNMISFLVFDILHKPTFINYFIDKDLIVQFEHFPDFHCLLKSTYEILCSCSISHDVLQSSIEWNDEQSYNFQIEEHFFNGINFPHMYIKSITQITLNSYPVINNFNYTRASFSFD